MRKCILCGTELNDESELMICSNMPASAQDIPDKDELDDDFGMDLRLCQCFSCGLVQFDCEPVSYFRDVIRAGGYSSTMKELRCKQYDHFIEFCHLDGKKIIEVGCGQGEFLEILKEYPVDVYGIEHKKDLVDKAVSKGLNVWEDFADNSSKTLLNGPFDAFLSFNFLEHQPDPNGMMRCIYNNLTDEGVGLVTVPNFEYILENDAFYELLRDHIANYTSDTLAFLMNKNGFEILERTVVNRDTISFIVRKRTKVNIEGIKNNFKKLSDQVQRYVNSKLESGKKIAVWGASHQGFTALSTTGVADNIKYVIDSAPFKQGKFSPASHVPIVSPDHFFEDPVDCIIIIAPGYSKEISDIIRTRFGTHIEIATIMNADIEEL